MYLEKKKNAIINAVQSGGRLPSEYQEVEWIGSSGTQYIDTGMSISVLMSYEIDFSTEETNLSYLLGGFMGSFIGIQRCEINTNRGLFIKYMNTVSQVKETGWLNVGNLINERKLLKVNNQPDITTVEINDNIIFTNNDSKTEGTVTVHFYLFGSKNYYGYTEGLGNFKIYSCKIFKNSIIERNMIPCYRKADDEIGMYDLVNDTFYTNQGTGTFTKGNDV